MLRAPASYVGHTLILTREERRKWMTHSIKHFRFEVRLGRLVSAATSQPRFAPAFNHAESFGPRQQIFSAHEMDASGVHPPHACRPSRLISRLAGRLGSGGAPSAPAEDIGGHHREGPVQNTLRNLPPGRPQSSSGHSQGRSATERVRQSIKPENVAIRYVSRFSRLAPQTLFST